MTEKTILVEEFPFISFSEVYITQSANQHMKAKIIGLVDGAFAKEHEQMVPHDKQVSVWVSEENEKRSLWLTGIINDIEFRVCGGVYSLSLELASLSKRSDTRRHTRTFQDPTLTYKEVVSILQEHSGTDKLEILISGNAGNESIGTLLVQYEETDWEFLRRLASRFHSTLFPCENLGCNGIYIGINPHSEKHILDTAEYTVHKDINGFRKNRTDTTWICYEQSAISYIITSGDIYQLRDCICLNGMQPYVYAIESRLVDAQIIHTYTLKSEHGFQTRANFNRNLVGLALIGNVRAVECDRVQVRIENDLEQRDYHWFPYSTSYSSPDNTGWYFMPEIGDQVRLVFPNKNEAESYVVSSVHMGDRGDPDTKSIRTRYQKEIVFAPNFISISNGTGSQIELHDEKGITISSDKQILIESEEDINIKSRQEIHVLGDAGVMLRQKDNEIEIHDTVDITAGRLRLR